ncbi:MAG TPA: CehA/McbA family metallohydrolase [Polyangiaceae bacterium]|jgi:hypothetical protein|nr:CehA/McbA family metallohydrolase [Polyangiaceae bacterium]
MLSRDATCLLSLVLAACAAREDVTPLIAVDPRAAGRIDLLAHEEAPAAAAPARVHVLKSGDQLGGPNAIGRPGDLVLENDEVVFVVDQLGSSWGFAESGGNLVDAADARSRKDELGQLFTYFGTFPRQGVYDSLTSGTSADGSAWVAASGKELYEPALRVTTRYTLHPPDRALLIETTVENAGAAPVGGLSLGDAIQWGGAEKFAPGKTRGFKGPSSGPFIGGIGRFASYAITSTSGAIDGTSGSAWTDTAQEKSVSLAPGAKVTYARVFVVGERPDSTSLVSELAASAAQPVGSVEVGLAPEAGEAAAAVPPDARVALTPVTSPPSSEALTLHAAGSPPKLEGYAPVGTYAVTYLGGGGRAGRGSGQVTVTAGGEARADLTVSRPAGAHVVCADAGGPMPCKVTFERTDGAPNPDFGPAHAAGPARNQATTPDGVVDVALAAGAYRVTASRGPAYSIDQATFVLAPGDTKELTFAPRAVLDTHGYRACDFHQHTMLGADAPVATRDRVIANAAEGVEVAVATEHNVVADLEPIVRDLHLDGVMVAIPGDEITSDASRHAWGHANAWPLPVNAADPRGGAPAVRDRTPHEVFEELRKTAPTDFVLQVNHPRSGSNGYFDLLGFDPAHATASDPAYDATFDAVEVWNGRNVDARAKVLADFFGLLRAGYPVTPTADTDTHGIVGQEAGYPRTYVRMSNDAPIAGWDASRTADVVKGVKGLRDVVLTNGPMLRVSAGGPNPKVTLPTWMTAGIGGIVKGRVIPVRVHVESAPWIVVDSLRVVKASDYAGGADKAGKAGNDAKPVPVLEKPNARGALAADLDVTVRADADDAFVVIVSGSAPMSPVLPIGPGGPAEITPWAMTGAIWIDADGDGKSLGR